MLTSALEFIGELIHSTLNFNDIMNSVIKHASIAVGSDTAAISLKQGDKRVVSFTYGFDPDITGIVLNDDDEPHAALAISNKKPVYIEDTNKDPRVNIDHMMRFNIRAVITIPVLANDEAVGVIFLNYSREPQQFDDDIKFFANSLGISVSQAIQNSRQYEAAIEELNEHKRNEQIILRQNELLSRQAMLLNLSHEAIFAYELDGPIIFWNRGAERIYGYGSEDAIGCRPTALLLTVYPGSYDMMIGSLKQYGEWTGQVEHTCAAGKKIIVETRMQIVYSELGNQIVLESNRDITERIRMNQAEKEKYEALEKTVQMKDEFISLISHEFKTPLTVINIAIQAMKLICKDELSERAIGYLNKIQKNSNRQLKLVNNLLDITRANAGHLKISKSNVDIVNLTRLVTESVTLIAESKNIKVTFASAVHCKIIGIDVEKFERILLNLLSNAIKFTPEGKSVEVRLSQKSVGGKSYISITVRDNGIGIPADKIDIIFDRFGQVDNSLSRKAEGTGIGLAIAKMFTEKMEGMISAESEEGKGSAFTVMFPASREKKSAVNLQPEEIGDERLIKTASIEFSDIY